MYRERINKCAGESKQETLAGGIDLREGKEKERGTCLRSVIIYTLKYIAMADKICHWNRDSSFKIHVYNQKI